jgi:hypothetical protein
MHDKQPEPEAQKVITLHPGKERTYEQTIVANHRRYQQHRCQHKGPYLVDRELAAVECGDCGAHLNPLYVLELLACQEAYWNQRVKDVTAYLGQIQEELAARTRTKCTHCGNMTAIKFQHEIPQTWVPQPF